MKIALTGGIACGKSLLSRFLNEFGVETIDADDVVHELLPDPAERRRIAAEVFADPAKRKELEAKIHPIVRQRIERFFDAGDAGPLFPPDTLVPHALKSNNQTIKQSSNLKIAVIPLLFEVHWAENFDIISCVVSTREKQIERMVTNRAMTRAEAEARLAEEKAKRSHYVIRNDGTPDDLRAQARAFVEWLSIKQSNNPHNQTIPHVRLT